MGREINTEGDENTEEEKKTQTWWKRKAENCVYSEQFFLMFMTSNCLIKNIKNCTSNVPKGCDVMKFPDYNLSIFIIMYNFF